MRLLGTGRRRCALGTRFAICQRRCNPTGVADFKEIVMGKYFLGWLLGVPVVVLVLLWFFFS